MMDGGDFGSGLLGVPTATETAKHKRNDEQDTAKTTALIPNRSAPTIADDTTTEGATAAAYHQNQTEIDEGNTNTNTDIVHARARRKEQATALTTTAANATSPHRLEYPPQPPKIPTITPPPLPPPPLQTRTP